MCGMKDSLQSTITPRNLVSATTGMGVPFSRRVSSRWNLHNLEKCMHTVLEGENLNPLVSAVCKFIETLLEVTLDNMDKLRSVADQKVIDI